MPETISGCCGLNQPVANKDTQQYQECHMQNENLQDETVMPVQSRRFFPRLSKRACLGILAITLLVAGALGAVALNHLAPPLPNRAQGFPGRVAWYVHNGQLKADLHTATSAIQYLVSRDAELPATPVSTNLPVAGKMTPAPARS
jgi:hypothetical protein